MSCFDSDNRAYKVYSLVLYGLLSRKLVAEIIGESGVCGLAVLHFE